MLLRSLLFLCSFVLSIVCEACPSRSLPLFSVLQDLIGSFSLRKLCDATPKKTKKVSDMFTILMAAHAAQDYEKIAVIKSASPRGGRAMAALAADLITA